MKKKGAVCLCADERVRDIMTAYDRCIAECRHIFLPSIYERVSRSPARRFYVSPSRAAYVVSASRRGMAGLSAMRAEKRKMFEEIIRRVEAKARSGDTRPLLAICEEVVSQPAPSFYLAAASVKLVVCKFREKWNREKREKLPLSLWRQG